MFIQQDAMDRLLYEDQRDDNPGLGELEQTGEAKTPIWPDVVQDVWSGLFKQDPQMAEDANGPLAKAMAEVMETQEWKNLREQTRLDLLGSSIGTMTFGKSFLEALPDEVFEAEEAAQIAQNAEDALQEAGSDTDMPVPQEMLNQMQAQADAACEAADLANAKAQKACDGNLETMVRVAARSAAKDASKEAELAKEAMIGWGVGEGQNTRLPLAEQMRLFEKIKNDEALRLFSEMVGRMKRLARGYQAKKINQSPEEIYAIETGNDLASVLPFEMAKLLKPATKRLFMLKYAERSLTQYAKRGTENAGKGPILIMRDESGSMYGERMQWANAVALGLSYVAQKQKRALIVGGFSSSGEVWTREYTNGAMKPEDIEGLVTHYYGGGTDFEMALRESLKAITSSAKSKKADIVFVSDGDCYVSSDYKRVFEEERKRLGIRCYSIGVGCSDASFRDFSDACWGFKGNLKADDPALERIFSI